MKHYNVLRGPLLVKLAPTLGWISIGLFGWILVFRSLVMPVPKYPPDGDPVTEQILERLLRKPLG